MFGLDYVTGPPISALHGAGVGFVCRYLSEINDLTQAKVLAPAEAKALSQAGIAIVSNYEWYANRALEGAASGVQDAQIAASQHKACGGPADKPIYFSVDFDAAPDQLPAVGNYFRGVASVIDLSRTAGYGPYEVIKYLFDNHLISYGWQTYAWSGGAWEARAHIQQYQNGMSLAGASVDYNRSIKADFGQWLVQGGSSMQIYAPTSADFGAWFVSNDRDHWTCKQTGCVVQFGIKNFYAKLSLDGNLLPIIGLPITNEIYMSINGQNVVLQVYERGGIYYDPAHVKDNQPGTGECSICHLTDQDFVKNIPGITLPAAPVDTTALIAAINAIPDAIAQATATATAQAVLEAKKL